MCHQSAVSADLQEYFFPKEDTTVKHRQQQWVKSVALRRKSAAVLGESDKAAFPGAPSRYALLASPSSGALFSWSYCVCTQATQGYLLLSPAAYGTMLHCTLTPHYTLQQAVMLSSKDGTRVFSIAQTVKPQNPSPLAEDAYQA